MFLNSIILQQIKCTGIKWHFSKYEIIIRDCINNSSAKWADHRLTNGKWGSRFECGVGVGG